MTEHPGILHTSDGAIAGRDQWHLYGEVFLHARRIPVAMKYGWVRRDPKPIDEHATDLVIVTRSKTDWLLAHDGKRWSAGNCHD